MRRAVLLLLATGALAVCGVKGPPRPPEAAQAEAPPAEAKADAGTRP